MFSTEETREYILLEYAYLFLECKVLCIMIVKCRESFIRVSRLGPVRRLKRAVDGTVQMHVRYQKRNYTYKNLHVL